MPALIIFLLLTMNGAMALTSSSFSCLIEPTLILEAGESFLSNMLTTPVNIECEATMYFANPLFLPITFTFDATSCDTKQINMFQIPKSAPNGIADVVWRCSDLTPSCYRVDISNGFPDPHLPRHNHGRVGCIQETVETMTTLVTATRTSGTIVSTFPTVFTRSTTFFLGTEALSTEKMSSSVTPPATHVVGDSSPSRTSSPGGATPTRSMPAQNLHPTMTFTPRKETATLFTVTENGRPSGDSSSSRTSSLAGATPTTSMPGQNLHSTMDFTSSVTKTATSAVATEQGSLSASSFENEAPTSLSGQSTHSTSSPLSRLTSEGPITSTVVPTAELSQQTTTFSSPQRASDGMFISSAPRALIPVVTLSLVSTITATVTAQCI